MFSGTRKAREAKRKELKHDIDKRKYSAASLCLEENYKTGPLG